MGHHNISKYHLDVLTRGAKHQFFPHNVPCRCRCAFCDEAKLTELLPWIKRVLIPPYTPETFDFYQRAYKKYKSSAADWLSIQRVKNELRYFPCCDFFSLGLNRAQIETLILNAKEKNLPLLVSTTGFNADLGLIKYFSKKYPKIFKLHLSIITFNREIREKTIRSNIDTANLKKICAVAKQPTYFLLYFNKGQVASDIDILNNFSIRNRGIFYIHRLYYNKLSPGYIKDYSVKAEDEFEKIVFYLKINDKKLKNISKRAVFGPPSKIHAWASREKIKQLLEKHRLTKEGIIFCSQGAGETIKSIVGETTNVVPVEGCLGGCVDLSLTITAKDILSIMEKMIRNGVTIKDIYIPNTMFSIQEKYDFNGDSAALIKKTYPTIKINVIEIPPDIVNSNVSLDTCIYYYNYKALPDKLGLDR